MMGISVVLAAVLALPAGGGTDDDRLKDLLHEHFQAKTRSRRESLERKILKIDGLSPRRLAGAIRGLELWEPQPAGEYELTLRLRKGKSSEKHLWVYVPEEYDPGKRWPLLITMHGAKGNGRGMLSFTRRMLGSLAGGFIIAAPHEIGPLGFSMPVDVVARPRHLLRALRHMFHLDSDRVYLMGYSLGGHDTWMAMIMHADCFAGGMPLAGTLRVVGGELLYDELMGNVRNTFVSACWGAEDTLGPDGEPGPRGGIAGINRKLSATAQALGLKKTKMIELAGVGHEGVQPPRDLLAKLLTRQRRRFPKRVHQVYRLPDQSDAYWVSSDRLLGEPLPDGRLQIPVEQGQDPLVAQREWLIGRLGSIEARCRGQTIELATRRSGYVTLLLSDELLDLDRPVMIIRNGKKRFEGRVRRDLRVMLREAAGDWDFARLPTARAVIPVGGKVRFGYPETDSKEGRKTRKKKGKD